MGGGGKGGGGGASAAASLNFSIIQMMLDQQKATEAQAKQDELNAQAREDQKNRDRQSQENWQKTFDLQKSSADQSQANWNQQMQMQSSVGNVDVKNAAKSGTGGSQDGRVKTLYSAASARTRGKRVTLGGSGSNEETVFKRVLGE
jgi:hypothetical protein